MSIQIPNGTGFPAFSIGAIFQAAESPSYYYPEPDSEGQVIQIEYPDQIGGLVPVFPCTGGECRQGLFGGDLISDESLYPLPVFATPDDDLTYHNDVNSWLFDVPAISNGLTFYDFFLEKLIGTTWTPIETLDNGDFGIYYDINSLCEGLKWKGYYLRWKDVLAAHGEGMYRFRLSITIFGVIIDPLGLSVPIVECMVSPPFCLQEWDCVKANRTVKFETTIIGGRIGHIDKTNCGHKYWDFCCKHQPENPTFGAYTTAIKWLDSIRIFGFFGREAKDYERTSIKYPTGLVNKIRDEAIRKFKFRSFGNTASAAGKGYPQWMHDRLAVYAFQAENLYVSDYNLNNADYNLKGYCVVADGNYLPEYKGHSRYSNVEVDFKAQYQYLIRNRCC